jgi:para-nitrobenzyl esterase
MQTPDPGDAAPPGNEPSEDCLYLNIWRPSEVPDGTRLPVLVWIHGGAYVNGGSSTPIHDGSFLASKGLIVVTFNYRLGRFGYFSHPALIEADEGPLGNFGLMDQVEALKWVQRNIGAFGGDPDQVTVMGESAGGESVLHLLTSPQSNGLFQRAIVMSGGGRDTFMELRPMSEDLPKTPSAATIGLNYARSVGIEGTDAGALKALRALPASKLCADLNMSALLKLPEPLTFAKGPFIDEITVLGNPGQLIGKGQAARVPLLIGTTSGDVGIRLPDPANPFQRFGADAQRAQTLYPSSQSAGAPPLLLQIAADFTLHEPARFVARSMVKAGSPVWRYRFSYIPECMRGQWTGGAPHASDVPFAFGTIAARFGDKLGKADREMAEAFASYIANFVKSGDPNGPNLPEWKPHDDAELILEFTPDDGPVLKPDPWKDRLDLVEKSQGTLP